VGGGVVLLFGELCLFFFFFRGVVDSDVAGFVLDCANDRCVCSVLLAMTVLVLPALFAKQKRALKTGGSA